MKRVILVFVVMVTTCSCDWFKKDEPTPVEEWVRVTDGKFPEAAFEAGKEKDGTVLFIARAVHDGGIVVGKAQQNQKYAYFPYGGKEVGLEEFEIYTGKGKWQKINEGETIPANALKAGNEPNGQHLYISRVEMEGGVHNGKARSNTAFISFGGKELVFNAFEVLVSE